MCRLRFVSPSDSSEAPVVVVALLVLLGVLSSSPEGALAQQGASSEFLRNCATAVQCVFEPRGSGDRVYLDCQNGECSCSNFAAIRDVPVWNLFWSPSNQDCLIDEFGPCGRDNGLEISCRPELQCLKGRCRAPGKVGSHSRGEYCHDDIDCQRGLSCKRTKKFFLQPQKYCVRDDEEEEEEEQEEDEEVEETEEQNIPMPQEEKPKLKEQPEVSRPPPIVITPSNSNNNNDRMSPSVETSVRLNINDKSPAVDVQNNINVPSSSPSPVVVVAVSNKTLLPDGLPNDEDILGESIPTSDSSSFYLQSSLITISTLVILSTWLV